MNDHLKTSVQAINWKEIVIHGRAAHAGTTPHQLRRNAGLAASLINVAVTEMVESGEYGQLLANVGRLDIAPNSVNIVPSRALMTVDLRNTRDDDMGRVDLRLQEIIAEVSERCGVDIEVETTARTGSVTFADEVKDRVAKSTADLGLTAQEIMSGAGHDAGEMALIAPTGMIFVPGLYDGISHNPREYSTPEACEDGINVLLQVVTGLAAE